MLHFREAKNTSRESPPEDDLAADAILHPWEEILEKHKSAKDEISFGEWWIKTHRKDADKAFEILNTLGGPRIAKSKPLFSERWTPLAHAIWLGEKFMQQIPEGVPNEKDYEELDEDLRKRLPGMAAAPAEDFAGFYCHSQRLFLAQYDAILKHYKWFGKREIQLGTDSKLVYDPKKVLSILRNPGKEHDSMLDRRNQLSTFCRSWGLDLGQFTDRAIYSDPHLRARNLTSLIDHRLNHHTAPVQGGREIDSAIGVQADA